MESAAALLGVTSLALYRGLSKRTKLVKGQTVVTTPTSKLANEARDALARTLYYRCVSAIVRRANILKANAARPSSGVSSSDESSAQDSGKICEYKTKVLGKTNFFPQVS